MFLTNHEKTKGRIAPFFNTACAQQLNDGLKKARYGKGCFLEH